MTNRVAFSYIRMSTEQQLKGHSLLRQLELARSYADQRHLNLIEDFRDIGISAHKGQNAKTGKLGIFIDELKNGNIPKDSVLIVESLDRLSRMGPMEAFGQFSLLLEHGIEIHTIFDNQIYSKDTLNQNPGLLFSSIGYMLRAHSESSEKSTRLKKAWDNKRKNLSQRILTSQCPAWLFANEHKTGFIIKENTKKTIQTIFDLCIDKNMGVFSIASYLNKNSDIFPIFSNKSLNPNGVWHKSYILKILTNKAVYGQFSPLYLNRDDEELNDYFPQIITKDRFLLAQAKLHDRVISGGGRKGEAFNNLFSKLLFCGHCGSRIHYVDKGNGPKGGKYLRCANTKSTNSCKPITCKYADFEAAFMKFVSDVNISDIVNNNNTLNRIKNIQEKIVVETEKLKEYEINLLKVIDIMSAVNENSKKHIIDKINNMSLSIEESKAVISSLGSEIIKLRSIQGSTIDSDAYNNFIKKNQSLSDENKYILRKSLNGQLVSLIDSIKLYNFPWYPWEIESNASKEVKDKLANIGISSQKEYETFFSSKAGKDLLNEVNRHFVVRFKNNQVRTVKPFLNKSYIFDESRFIAMAKRSKEKHKVL